jgi:hypothetical protein
LAGAGAGAAYADFGTAGPNEPAGGPNGLAGPDGPNEPAGSGGPNSDAVLEGAAPRCGLRASTASDASEGPNTPDGPNSASYESRFTGSTSAFAIDRLEPGRVGAVVGPFGLLGPLTYKVGADAGRLGLAAGFGAATARPGAASSVGADGAAAGANAAAGAGAADTGAASSVGADAPTGADADAPAPTGADNRGALVTSAGSDEPRFGRGMGAGELPAPFHW